MPAIDQFACGSVLWEALVGRKLFDGATDYEVYTPAARLHGAAAASAASRRAGAVRRRSSSARCRRTPMHAVPVDARDGAADRHHAQEGPAAQGPPHRARKQRRRGAPGPGPRRAHRRSVDAPRRSRRSSPTTRRASSSRRMRRITRRCRRSRRKARWRSCAGCVTGCRSSAARRPDFGSRISD